MDFWTFASQAQIPGMERPPEMQAFIDLNLSLPPMRVCDNGTTGCTCCHGTGATILCPHRKIIHLPKLEIDWPEDHELQGPIAPPVNAYKVTGKRTQATTPTHYNDTSITALDVIDDWGLDFRLGNTIKYIARHQKKGSPVEDLEKAQEYLRLAIEHLTKPTT